MRPLQILHKHPKVQPLGLSSATFEELDELLSGGASLEELFRKKSLTLPAQERLEFWQLWHHATVSGTRLERLNQSRTDAGQELIPATLATLALQSEIPLEIEMLSLLLADLPSVGLPKHLRHEAISAGLELWRGCLMHLYEEVSLSIEDKAYPPLELCSLEESAALFTSISQGKSLSFEWPIDAFSEVAAHCGSALNSLVQQRPPVSFFKSLFEPIFTQGLIELKARQVMKTITDGLGEWLHEKMALPRAEGQSFAGAWSSDGEVTVVIVNRDGKLSMQRRFEGYENDLPTLAFGINELLKSGKARRLACPEGEQRGSLSPELKAELERHDVELSEGSTEGLSSTRWLSKQSLDVQGALRLTQRMIRPSRFWGQSDLEALLLGWIPKSLLPHLSLSELLRVIDERRQLSIQTLKVPPREKKKREKAQPKRPENEAQSLKELTRGMPLKGIVTRLKAFGAFVDLNLEQEGMIHLSELSTKRISHPSHVLKVGQEVEVHVLSVDLARSRLSLTLRGAPEAPRGDRSEEERSLAPAGRRRGGDKGERRGGANSNAPEGRRGGRRGGRGRGSTSGRDDASRQRGAGARDQVPRSARNGENSKSAKGGPRRERRGEQRQPAQKSAEQDQLSAFESLFGKK
ncbi:MAG: S1 RNA-binding domain-containing protein [Myxococcota bacterium]|nr:S1 RNA-binding domain-containing protein [Myxococcota bacterium]